MESLPTKIISQIDGVIGYFCHGVFTRLVARQAIAPVVEERVGEGAGIEIGKHRLENRVIAEPAVQD